jgi:hypothetical protein
MRPEFLQVELVHVPRPDPGDLLGGKAALPGASAGTAHAITFRPRIGTSGNTHTRCPSAKVGALLDPVGYDACDDPASPSRRA